jgi:hypothetical protein
MPRLTDALDELKERLSALGVEGEGVTFVLAEPESLQRAVLSGYVPTEDADQAIQFVEECGDALLTMMGRAPSAAAMRAGLRMTVAQVLALGVTLERQEEGDG